MGAVELAPHAPWQRPDWLVRRLLKPVLFVSLLSPALLLVFGIFSADLGADPQKYLVHKTGNGR